LLAHGIANLTIRILRHPRRHDFCIGALSNFFGNGLLSAADIGRGNRRTSANIDFQLAERAPLWSQGFSCSQE